MAEKKDEPQFADSDHQLVMQQFEEYADGTISARQLAEKCRNYLDGNQWTAAEQETLRKRKQPCITDNKIRDKTDTLLGMERQQRTDPKAFPRNPSPEDEQSAEAASDALRFIADQSQYHQTTRKPAAENLTVEGFCAGQVIVEKRKGTYAKVCMEHIRWDRAYYDIHSLKLDFSDKRYCGYFTWMDQDEAIEKQENNKKAAKGWREALEQSITQMSQAGPDKSLDDKPRYAITVRNRARVQVFKHYFIRKGVWHECVWVMGGWLEEPKPCAYKDENGEPMCCMEIHALYREGDDGHPYGRVKRDLDLQDEHNKRRSKMLHLLNSKRVIAQKGAVTDEDGGLNKIRAELHKPDGVIEYNGNIEQLRIEDNIKEAEGQWRLLQQTDMALSQTGPNDALMGTSGSLSGVAKARDQQAGQLPLSPLFEALDAWELRMYRQSWCRVKQYWTAQMWVRITDDEKKPKWVGLNQPVLMGDKLAQAAAQDPQFQQLPDEQKRGVIQEIARRPEAQQQYMNDKTGKPARKNDVAEMDVDIIIDRGQDVVTVQQEEFSMLVEVAKGRPEVPFTALLKLSQLRPTTKKQVLEEMKGAQDPMAAQRAQFEQMMQQLQALIAQANVRKTNAQADQAEAAAQESHIDAAVKVAEFATPADPNSGEPGAQPAAKKQVSVN